MAISTSGNSKNLLLAIERAKKMDIKTILLTGFQGGKARSIADLSILAPGEHTAEVQESHIVIYHTLCFMVEHALVENGFAQYL